MGGGGVRRNFFPSTLSLPILSQLIFLKKTYVTVFTNFNLNRISVLISFNKIALKDFSLTMKGSWTHIQITEGQRNFTQSFVWYFMSYYTFIDLNKFSGSAHDRYMYHTPDTMNWIWKKKYLFLHFLLHFCETCKRKFMYYCLCRYWFL